MSMMPTTVKGRVTAVAYTPQAMTLSEGAQTLGVLRHVHEASPWWIGDLLNFLESMHGQSWSQAVADINNRDIDLMMSYMRVALAYPEAQRREGVSFSHHQVLQGLPSEERARWLERVATEDISVKRLRQLLLEESADGKAQDIKIPRELINLVKQVTPQLISMCANPLAGEQWQTEALVEDDIRHTRCRVEVSVTITEVEPAPG